MTSGWSGLVWDGLDFAFCAKDVTAGGFGVFGGRDNGAQFFGGDEVIVRFESIGYGRKFEEVSIFAIKIGSGGEFLGGETGVFGIIFDVLDTVNRGAQLGLRRFDNGRFDDGRSFGGRNAIRYDKRTAKS